MDNFMFAVRSILTTTPDRWMKLAVDLPADLLAEVPKPGEWSAVACLQHIVDTERVFQTRLVAFQEGVDFPAFNPDSQGTRQVKPSARDLAGEFVRLRQESLRALDGLQPGDFDRRARHAELGPVTLGQMIYEWAAHDLNHTVQAERALMQPFLRGCGPWQKYFTDHLIG